MSNCLCLSISINVALLQHSGSEKERERERKRAQKKRKNNKNSSKWKSTSALILFVAGTVHSIQLKCAAWVFKVPPAQTTRLLPATWIWIASVQTETLLCECASRHNSGDACSLTAHCWSISIHSHFSGFTSTQNSIPYSSFKAQKTAWSSTSTFEIFSFIRLSFHWVTVFSFSSWLTKHLSDWLISR